jgi:hypothetical protein
MKTIERIQAQGFVPRLYLVDETEYYSEDFIEMCKHLGSLHTVYLYDASSCTRCCEITPSYHCSAITIATEHGAEISDDLYDELRNIVAKESSQCHYFHCSSVDGHSLGLNADHTSALDADWDFLEDDDLTREQKWDKIVENIELQLGSLQFETVADFKRVHGI